MGRRGVPSGREQKLNFTLGSLLARWAVRLAPCGVCMISCVLSGDWPLGGVNRFELLDHSLL